MEGPAASSRRLGRIKHALVCEWNLFKIDHLSPIQREAVPTIFTPSADRGILDISPDIHDFALREQGPSKARPCAKSEHFVPNLNLRVP
jgi:hypothetical protein